jgi:PAS domain S-box-containing protein
LTRECYRNRKWYAIDLSGKKEKAVNNQTTEHKKQVAGSDVNSFSAVSESSFQELVIDIFSSFACASSEDCEAAINSSLKKMAEYVGADRAFICAYDFERQISINTHEWCAPDVEPQISNSQAVPVDSVMEYGQCHLKGEICQVEDVSVLTPGAYKDFLTSQQIKSFCTVPMMSGTECRGFVGFDSVKQRKVYSENEITLLKSFAQAVTNFLQRQKDETDLRLSEERHRGVAEDAPAMICEYLHDGTRTFVNQDYSDYHGTPRDQLIGTSFLECLSPEYRDKVRSIYLSLTPEQPLNVDTNSFIHHGELKWHEWRTRGFFDQKGQAVRFQAVGIDITETKNIQEQIKKQSALIKGLLDSIPEQVFYKDKEGVFLGCNERFAENYGLTKQDIIGSTDYDHLSKKKADESYRADQDVIENQRLHKKKAWSIDPAGQKKLYKTVKAPLFTEQGDVIGIVGVTRDITEQWMLEDSLLKAKESAEAANVAKSQFLANMSHELRTPLHRMRSSLVLMKEAESKQELTEYIHIAEESTQILQHKIDQVLDFSLIESSDVILANMPFKMKNLLEEVKNQIQPYMTHEQVRFTMVMDEHIPPDLIGDTTRLKQVLNNLISNAAKFTPHGEIELRVNRLEQQDTDRTVTLMWQVKDSGIGIPEKNLAEIFNSFTQVDSTDNRKYGGTGLGLAICKRIVSLMGGSIWAESKEDVGSSFYFTSMLELPEPSHLERMGILPEQSPFHLLAVDDDSFGLFLIEKIAARNGWLLTTATNGREAVEACKKNHFDVILMDVQMPVMNGYEATAAIRQLDNTAQIPIIAITARALEGDRVICLAAGMNDYLSKPFTVEMLTEKIERWRKNGNTA